MWFWGNYCNPLWSSLWSSVSWLSYCPNPGLLVNHFLTLAFICVILWRVIAFSCSSASSSLFCGSSSMARAATRYKHLLFAAMIVSLTFITLFLAQPIQEWQRIDCNLVFKWHAQVSTIASELRKLLSQWGKHVKCARTRRVKANTVENTFV